MITMVQAGKLTGVGRDQADAVRFMFAKNGTGEGDIRWLRLKEFVGTDGKVELWKEPAIVLGHGDGTCSTPWRSEKEFLDVVLRMKMAREAEEEKERLRKEAKKGSRKA